jgi:spore germination protein KB
LQKAQIINERQIGWLTGAILTGGGLVSIQNVLIRISRVDTWFAYLLPTLYVFVVVAVFSYLAKTFPRKHLFDIMFELFGRWGGGVLNAVFIFHIWLILIRDLALFNRFFSTILLPQTPIEILSMLFMFVLVYYGRSSLEVVARVNDVFFPLFVLMILVIPFALGNEIHVGLMQPIMTTSYWKFLSSNLIACSWFSDIFVLGAFLHMLHNSKQLSAGLRRGATVSAFILSLTLLTEVAVFGPYLPGNFMYPSYSLVQQIHITDFLDRVDLIMLMIWFPTTACKVLTVYIALLTGLVSFTKRRDLAAFNKPLALFLLISALVSFQSTTEVFNYGNYSSVAIVLAYQPLFLVLLVIGTKRYLRRHQEQTAETAPPVSGGDNRRKPDNSIWLRLSAKYPYPIWFKASNAVLICLIAVTTFGFLLGHRWAWGGQACGLLFIVGMVVFLFTTFAEIKTVQDD